MFGAVQSFVERLSSLDHPMPTSGWSSFKDVGRAPALICVQTRSTSRRSRALLTPFAVVHRNFAASICSSTKICPCPPAGLSRFAAVYAGERSEYVRLTLILLRPRCLELASESVGGDTVLPGQKVEVRQRVVWHGAWVSEAATTPPAPRHLASPCVFGFVDLDHGRRLRVTKRDCRTWFDQLVRPEPLRSFIGRPKV